MGKTTSAERMKKLREQLKQDQNKYESHKEKERARDKNRREKLKVKNTLSAISARECGRKETERKKKYRQKIKLKQNVLSNECTDMPIYSPNSNLGSFKCPQSLGKAVRRLQKVLPASPRKRNAVIQKLVYDNFPNVASKIFHKPLTKKTVSKDTTLMVQEFYSSDGISRQAPGIRDVKSIKDPKSGKRSNVQKRHMNMTVKEAYAWFKMEHPTDEIKNSKFYQLRPENIALATEMPHNVCVCKYHANFDYLIKSINRMDSSFPSKHCDLLSLTCCNLEEENCMAGNCTKCVVDLRMLVDEKVDMSSEIYWKQWKDDNIGRPKVIETKGTMEEAVDELQHQFHNFKKHFFVKRLQAKTFKDIKGSLEDDEVLLQVDYAENYLATSQDEIQSAHWSHKQVSVFTACAWTKGECVQSYAVVSDETTRDKYSVFACLKLITENLKQKFPSLTTIKLFSDGCSGQFKNRYTISNLCYMVEDYGLNGEWYFFATSHGKGAVDGVGAVAKGAVWNQVMIRKVIIDSAENFLNCVKSVVPKINFMLLTSQDIEENKEMLKKRWELVRKITGIQSQHFFLGYDKRNIVCGRTFLKSELHKIEVFEARESIYEMVYTDSENEENTNEEPHLDNTNIVGTLPTVDLVKPGTFLLVEFTSDRKKNFKYRYAVIAQSSVEEDGDVKVMCMRCVGDTGRTFKMDERDVSYVLFENILSVLPQPEIKHVRNRILYEFNGNVDIFETG